LVKVDQRWRRPIGALGGRFLKTAIGRNVQHEYGNFASVRNPRHPGGEPIGVGKRVVSLDRRVILLTIARLPAPPSAQWAEVSDAADDTGRVRLGFS